MTEKRFTYTRTCSRCSGTGVDPDNEDCICDCCVDGVEEMELTEAEATNYPGAERKA